MNGVVGPYRCEEVETMEVDSRRNLFSSEEAELGDFNHKSWDLDPRDDLE
jgi:hypothetical protein